MITPTGSGPHGGDRSDPLNADKIARAEALVFLQASAVLERAGGDARMAQRRFWQRTRSDPTLREAIVKLYVAGMFDGDDQAQEPPATRSDNVIPFVRRAAGGTAQPSAAEE